MYLLAHDHRVRRLGLLAADLDSPRRRRPRLASLRCLISPVFFRKISSRIPYWSAQVFLVEPNLDVDLLPVFVD